MMSEEREMSVKFAGQVHRLALLAAVLAVALALGAVSSRAASAQTTQYPVTPLVDCVTYESDANRLKVEFGYVNPNAAATVIPFSPDNYFEPFPDFRNQPTRFEPGVHHRVFTTYLLYDFSGGATELSWILQGGDLPGRQVATASNDPATYCAENADVALAQTAAPDVARAGAELTYTLTATNSGENRATGVIVSDQLPGGVELVSAEASQGSCSGTEAVICSIGSLEKDASATVTLVVRPNRAGVLTNTASVSAGKDDPDTTNNASTTRTTVVAPPAVATGPASDLTHDGATLYATVDPNGSETTYRFEYGTDTSYGESTPVQSAGAGIDGELVRAEISGLQPGATYHYRVMATNAQGTTEGEDRIFVIPTPEPANAAPVIEDLKPKPGSKIRGRTPTISATVRDAQTDLSRKNIRLWLDGKRVERFSYDRTNGQLSHTTKKLGYGRHTVLIVAKDGGGLSASRFWGFGVVKR